MRDLPEGPVIDWLQDSWLKLLALLAAMYQDVQHFVRGLETRVESIEFEVKVIGAMVFLALVVPPICTAVVAIAKRPK